MAKPRVFFDITADGKPLGRIVMEVRRLTAGGCSWLVCVGETGVHRGFARLHAALQPPLSGVFCRNFPQRLTRSATGARSGYSRGC